MSTDDFAAELEQSVAQGAAQIEGAAERAKARVADAVAGLRPQEPAPPEPAQPVEVSPRGLVSFDDADEPDAERSPMADYAFPDPATEPAELDPEGIPVWEDPP